MGGCDKRIPSHLPAQVCIITGGNAGVGKATAMVMAERGAHLILACRSTELAQEAAQASGWGAVDA